MSQRVVVTGANGHLGNTLVRTLIAGGDDVVAAVRAESACPALAGLPCRIAAVELSDERTMVPVFGGAQTVYLAGAVFKHWAREPAREIYQANLDAARRALEAAARCHVRRVVFVSSIAAADHSRLPIAGEGWNADTSNLYYRSKADSERLAWALAARYGVNMVSVLPGAMVGPRCFRDTPTMALLRLVLDGKFFFDPGFHFNFVDVREVASACVRAAEFGRAGERYLLANEMCTSTRELAEIARLCFPERRIPQPRALPRRVLELAASSAELWAKLTGTTPTLQRSFLSVFTSPERCDIGKARRELGFAPSAPALALERAFSELAAQSAS
jgi:dihydroflavonol-4-reductase